MEGLVSRRWLLELLRTVGEDKDALVSLSLGPKGLDVVVATTRFELHGHQEAARTEKRGRAVLGAYMLQRQLSSLPDDELRLASVGSEICFGSGDNEQWARPRSSEMLGFRRPAGAARSSAVDSAQLDRGIDAVRVAVRGRGALGPSDVCQLDVSADTWTVWATYDQKASAVARLVVPAQDGGSEFEPARCIVPIGSILPIGAVQAGLARLSVDTPILNVTTDSGRLSALLAERSTVDFEVLNSRLVEPGEGTSVTIDQPALARAIDAVKAVTVFSAPQVFLRSDGTKLELTASSSHTTGLWARGRLADLSTPIEPRAYTLPLLDQAVRACTVLGSSEIRMSLLATGDLVLSTPLDTVPRLDVWIARDRAKVS